MLRRKKGKSMFDDELEPRHKKQMPEKLDKYSLDELAERIVMLKAEIARTEDEIARKKAANAAATNFFKN
jgi:uncharacterized small protein (DUF1192 family)